ncbi:FUSC family protein [Actinoplanes teichomyceticus]|uniref:FUSC family protein n=1 Tax=Actinoplanes teichomyceticus TaxID=1867 RepID=UPI001A628907|nr:FUSC family protein [Actinoplanes teichomyceticus]GIF16682.1 hypothetical protein Ate01nite_67140 [Actinoplanes teichomyceticus]
MGRRLRRAALPAAEATAAAVLAWVVAGRVLGHAAPVFAPSAALIVLGESRGRRMRQSVEIMLGVAAGVLVAELAVTILGGGTGAIVAVLVLATAPMMAAGASSTLVVQAAASALYLVAVAAPHGDPMPFRFAEALIGGLVALATSQFVAARNPLAPLVAEARRTFAGLAGLLEDIGAALQRGDEPAAEAALDRAHRMHDCAERMRATVRAAGETLRLRVRRRRRLGQIREVEATTHQLDHVVGNVGVLARNAVTVTRLHAAVPAQLSQAVQALAAAVRAAGEALANDLSGHDDPARHAGAAEDSALTAVRIAAELLASGPPLPLAMIIGQIRLTAVDLLRGIGHDHDAVRGRVDEALGLS